MEVTIAISLLQQSRAVPKLRIKAIQYYGTAISHLRQQIDKFSSGDSEQELFFSASSCALFEVGSPLSAGFSLLTVVLDAQRRAIKRDYDTLQDGSELAEQHGTIHIQL